MHSRSHSRKKYYYRSSLIHKVLLEWHGAVKCTTAFACFFAYSRGKIHLHFEGKPYAFIICPCMYFIIIIFLKAVSYWKLRTELPSHAYTLLPPREMHTCDSSYIHTFAHIHVLQSGSYFFGRRSVLWYPLPTLSHELIHSWGTAFGGRQAVACLQQFIHIF